MRGHFPYPADSVTADRQASCCGSALYKEEARSYISALSLIGQFGGSLSSSPFLQLYFPHFAQLGIVPPYTVITPD
jgi:hypothetical protein